jgi:hypothetical protein
MRGFLLKTVALVCLFAPAKLRAQDSTGQGHQFQLAAGNDEWTTTGFKLAVGDLVVVFVAGSIRVNAVTGEVDANGRYATTGRETSGGIGTVEGKVGAGNPYPVGARFAFQADQPGTLKLRVRDVNYSDNSGSFTVTVVRIPAAAVPPVVMYTPEE